MKKAIGWSMFAVYLAVMLYLLFFRYRYTPDIPADFYWEYMLERVNLKPFNTIKLFLNVLSDPAAAYYRKNAIVNLLGNIIMFIPLGIFLPWLIKKCRSFFKTLIWTAIAISCVEVIQAFTLRGSGDVDDLILNLIGAAIGYPVFVWLNYKFRLVKRKTN